ncbi:VCBS repeat-containing protein [Fulvivirgaceae bacterium BMA10]|uniref:VCBS repeat-containing protein n=1 Tax=Splendidivirga corallicola TaxID=3051826 RepID=A0ABT8KI40_9BACT|nr:VCBS repeat-containing protein [Fulvivirgaceae bacterium BMA10]
MKKIFWVLWTGTVLLTSCTVEQEAGTKLFSFVSSDKTNIHFKNTIPEGADMNSHVYEYFYNGAGVAVGDINNDGLNDIYFVSNVFDNNLYLNKGDFEFKDITETSGVAGKRAWSTGVTMADINNDGLLDIYVLKSGKFGSKRRENELFINNGDLTFTESGKEMNLNISSYSTQAVFFDYDRDNDLDMFLLNHNAKLVPITAQNKAKKSNNAGDRLYRNDDGIFNDVTAESGISSSPVGYGLGVSAGDLNQDGWPDLYICNDYLEHDYLYLNNGDGTFSDKIKESTNHISNFSMGSDIADFNNDGLLDIMVLDMVAEDNYGIKTSMSGMAPERFQRAVDNGFHYQYMFNTLQLNMGNNAFSEVAHLSGVSNTDWSWAPLFADFDLDGWNDLYITNGLKRDFRNNDFRNYKVQRVEEAYQNKEGYNEVIKELVNKTPQRKTINYIFRNNRDLTFIKETEGWGLDVPSFSNGAAYADLDNDGDLDLVVNNIDDEAFILKNEAVEQGKGNYLKLNFDGPANNKFGIGVKVQLISSDGIQAKEHYLTRGYQSSVAPGLHFGTGKNKQVKIMATWPDGKQQILDQVATNQELTLKYREADLEDNIDPVSDESVSFSDITAETNAYFKHKENSFNDFEKESLLPHRMSRFGPGLAVGDIDGDGLEDFYVGGAAGQVGKMFKQKPDGKFISLKPSWEADSIYEDLGALLFDADQDLDLDLYVVSGGSEFDNGNAFYQDRLYLNDGHGRFRRSLGLPEINSSGSCVKAADYDQDGDLDLFIGGRLMAGQYPHPGRSYLLENDEGKFTDVTESYTENLSKIGMVTDAEWVDVDNDGYLDLVIVGEWMPITILRNTGNQFIDITEQCGFSNSQGWWFSIAADDMDGDGDKDLIVGNLGLNYKYKTSPDEPFQVYATDFDQTGTLDIVLGYYNQGTVYPLRGRECSSNQMPFIKEKFPSYHDFGQATLQDVYGSMGLENALHYEAKIFSTSYCENLGNGRFEIKPLPNETQFSSVNDILISDFNEDNHLDIIIGGNLYASEVETARNDAGYGLFLKGDGHGNFESVYPSESGLYLGGDVKALAMIGSHENDRLNILSAKNNDSIKLYHVLGSKNRMAK